MHTVWHSTLFPKYKQNALHLNSQFYISGFARKRKKFMFDINYKCAIIYV